MLPIKVFKFNITKSASWNVKSDGVPRKSKVEITLFNFLSVIQYVNYSMIMPVVEQKKPKKNGENKNIIQQQ